MVNSEAKTSDLLSDGTSPANSTGNTPDSGDALESPDEKRITKDVKLKRGGKSLLAFNFAFAFRFLLIYFVLLKVFCRITLLTVVTSDFCLKIRYLFLFS